MFRWVVLLCCVLLLNFEGSPHTNIVLLSCTLLADWSFLSFADLEMLGEMFNMQYGTSITVFMKQVRSWNSIQALFAKLKVQAQETRFIVIASTLKTLAILRAAEEVQMLSLNYHYIIANLVR